LEAPVKSAPDSKNTATTAAATIIPLKKYFFICGATLYKIKMSDNYQVISRWG